MALNGIDVSNYQAGINVGAVPCDFVIAKATEGTGYVSPACARQVDGALAAGKLAGVYHYVKGGDAAAEADFFVSQISGWVGRVVLAVDFEKGGNKAWGQWDYARKVLERVRDKTGVVPLLYGPAGAYAGLKQAAASVDAGLWIANYANMNATGYQASPWKLSAYPCAVYQYSSSGRLPGYAGSLDLDLFQGDAAAWRKYAGAKAQPSGPRALSPDEIAALVKSCANEMAADVYTIRMFGQSVVLDDVAASKSPDAPVDVWTANGTDAQRWRLQWNGDGTASLQNLAHGGWLTRLAPADMDGGPVGLRDGDGTLSQRWIVLGVGGGAWEILSAGDPRYALDVYAGLAQDGTKVQLFSRNDSAAQKWGFAPVADAPAPAVAAAPVQAPAATAPTTQTTSDAPAAPIAPTTQNTTAEPTAPTSADMADIKTQLAEMSGKLALIAKGL